MDEVVGDPCRIPADAVDEVRVAVVLEALAEDVEAGHGRAPAPLADLAGPVEHGQVQPRIHAAMTGRPQHAS